MAPQLALDILRLVAKELADRSKLEDVLNLSITSQVSHDIIYPILLRADAAAQSVTAQSVANLSVPNLSVANLSGHYCRPPGYYGDLGYPWHHSSRRSLIFFIRSENETLVEAYLKYTGLGVDTVIHSKSGVCLPILGVATRERAPSVVKFLLENGANPSGTGRTRINPLMWAICHCDPLVTRLLLDYGGLQAHMTYQNSSQTLHTNSPGSFENAELLNLIIHKAKDKEVVKAIIPYCSDLNSTDENGETAIHRLSRLGTSTQVFIAEAKVEALAEAGADVDVLTTEEESDGRLIRRTALNVASRSFQPEIIQTLLKLGASPRGATAFNLDREDGFSSGPPKDKELLLYAATTPIYDLLSEMHSVWRKRVRYKEVWNADFWWRFHNNDIFQSIEALTDHGLTGQQGMLDQNHNVLVDILLTIAQIKVDSSDMWELLIEGGAFDVHQRNEFGQTPLSQFASRCFGETLLIESSWKPNLIRSLVAAGSDPNTVDNSGMTPLHWAILYSDFDLVKLLIELGADPAKEVNGATPTHHAFGKPFARRGPVVRKVMQALRRRLTNTLYTKRTVAMYGGSRPPWSRISKIYRANIPTPEEPAQPFLQYQNGEWHPALSVCLDPVIWQQKTTIAGNAEKRMLSIIALLFPFSEVSRDENGHTPRVIAENAGVLKKDESLNLRDDFCIVFSGFDNVRKYYITNECRSDSDSDSLSDSKDPYNDDSDSDDSIPKHHEVKNILDVYICDEYNEYINYNNNDDDEDNNPNNDRYNSHTDHRGNGFRYSKALPHIRCGHLEWIDCEFCWAFPPPLLDLNTGKARLTFCATLNSPDTCRNGCYPPSELASMACFR